MSGPADLGLAGAVDWAVGYRLKLTTVFNEAMEGEVFAYDKATNILVLKQSAADGASGLCLLKANFIKSIDSTHKPASAPDLSLPNISAQQIQAEEERHLQAQALYDTLSKTLPCRWQGTSIVVLGEVEVRHPYQPDSVAALHGDTSAQERVRTMVCLFQRGNYKCICRQSVMCSRGTAVFNTCDLHAK